jgi:hypothetical protein
VAILDTFDFHAHFFSRPFFEALAAQAPGSSSVAERLAELVQRTGLELPSPDLGAHTRRWLAELQRHRVEAMACFASLPEETAAVAQACRDSSGKLIPFALVNPRAERAAEKTAALLDEQGFRGVLLFPAQHHYSPSEALCDPLWEALDERGAIAFVHCGLLVLKLRDLLGLPRTVDLAFASPIGLVKAAQRFGRVRFVIPHFGAGMLREALLVGASCPNVYVDSSSSNAWRKLLERPMELADVFERALAAFGPTRILFGTDSTTFPAGWRHERRTEQRAALDRLGLGPDDQARIFAGNARALLLRRAPGARATST